MKLKLAQDKIVKHSVRYALEEGTISMSVYVPKELILRVQMETKGNVEMKDGYPKSINLDLTMEGQG